MRRTGFWIVCLSALAVWAPDTNCHAFDLSTHRTILMDALVRSSFTVTGKTFSFDADVVFKIDEENGALDRGALLGSDPLWHVDNEKIAESNLRIIDYRSKVLEKLKGSNPEIGSARALLGLTLHTLADFYAHTNWVDMGNTGPNVDFGRRAIPQQVAGPSEQTCDASGATLMAAGLTKLTSGYYDGVFGCNLPAGKCRHGGAPSCKPGIAKDPGDSPRHAAAQKAAADAVHAFVSDLLIEAANAPGALPSLATKFASKP